MVTTSHATACQWQLEMFGDLRLFHNSQEEARFRTRKSGALLAYLALFPHSHTREHLAELFWKTSESREARNSLSVALHALRSVLKTPDRNARPIVLADSTTACLDAALLSSDVARFEQALHDANLAGDEDRRVACLREAIACYRGPLLPDIYDDWACAERKRLEMRAHEGLRQAAHLLAKRQEYHPALEYALRAATLDPLNEANCRDIMRLQSALGNPRAGLTHFQAFAQHLQAEVHLAPSASTVTLAKQITRQVSTGTRDSFAFASNTAALDRFFGREDELSTLRTWLEEGKTNTEFATLITLTGMGGVGKTRLAKEIARHNTSLFGTHIHFFNLAEETDAACLFETLCSNLRLPRNTDTDPLEHLASVLGAVPALLILDNFEQIVESSSQKVQQLRERLPNLTLLITSRQRLNVVGEREFALKPFPTPAQPSSEPTASLETLSCVQFFVARCRLHQADYACTPSNVQTIAKICARLDGLPLALELAAAWARVLSPLQLLARLEQRFELLVSTSRDVPNRHRSLRAAIEGSYRILRPESRRFFASLAIFADGWDLEAAQAVGGDDALAMLSDLRDASLVVTERDGEGTPRFGLLETLREFAAEQLTEEERAGIQQRYLAYFVALAEQGHQALQGREAPRWHARLEAEHDNFRAALALCFAQNTTSAFSSQDALASGIRLTTALMKFWHLRGFQAEWERWQKAAYAAADAAAPELRAALYMEIFDGYPAVVDLQFAGKALALGESLRYFALTAQAKLLMAYSVCLPQRLSHALLLTEEALTLLRQTDRRDLLGYALNRQAVLYCQGNRMEAQATFEESIAVLRQADALYLLTMSLFDAAFYIEGPRADERAEALLKEALDICVALDHYGGRAHGLWLLGKIARGRDRKRAKACFLESLELHQRYGFVDRKSLPLFELGYTALLNAEYAEARKFFLDAYAIRPAMAKEGIHYQLMWCALGAEDEAAFRFYCGEHLRLMDDGDAAFQNVGVMRMFAAVRAGNFAAAHLYYTELVRLWEQNTILTPPAVFFMATARWMADEGQLAIAARLLGMEDGISEGKREAYFSLETHLLAQTEHLLRAALPEVEQTACRAEGAAMNDDARRTFYLALPVPASC